MSLSLPTPDSFPAFPYDPPYSIQVQLMRHLYHSIEHGKVAIVESPTGTVSIPSRSLLHAFPHPIQRGKHLACFVLALHGLQMKKIARRKANTRPLVLRMVRRLFIF
jgi:Rad3-related DNA helicase